MAKIKVHVRTDRVGSKCEKTIDLPDWDEMEADEQDDACRDTMFDMIEWGYEVLE